MIRVFSARPPLTLAPARDAVDYQWYRDRLADPDLVNAGVSISLFRMPLLAVPVAGRRRGGFLSVGNLIDAYSIGGLLARRTGFPDTRVRWSVYPDTCHVVEWGGRPPTGGDDALGRFYGYSEAAIAEFAAGRPRFNLPVTAPTLAVATAR
ncbi:hypothetical protein EF903_06815 [Streptomyces sp. WAC05292]|uniref:DUF6302 family protein n=1 Tax=Streptomyces sp. WAC05292 TaxID=2487418 RepID=UPI000F73A765|nr:DUF6302 family protein [Streptomyces sp. WAC05292]RSS94244.1 hypothetical protein EF903_06815 [Streptomyces sp. WAC05292]